MLWLHNTLLIQKFCLTTVFSIIGVLYHRWQKYPEAEKAYLKALQLDARHKYAVDNYLLLQQQWQKGVNKPHTLHVK